MKKLLLLLFLIVFCCEDGLSQGTVVPHLTGEMFSETGLLSIGFRDSWKYQRGDDLQWADPGFDDSGWHAIAPWVSADAMPDSLWNGYGWWRISFTADSTLYNRTWNLLYYGWGASEVYLDGEKLHSYGRFSADPELEKTHAPVTRIDNPMSTFRLQPGEKHVIAVRYSHHQAKRNLELFPAHAVNLGFGIWIADNTYKSSREQSYLYASTVSVLCTSMLLLLTLLHLMLFFKFPGDKSNLLIALAIFLYFLSAASAFNRQFFGTNGFWYVIGDYSFAYFFLIASCLLPYVIARLFHLKEFYWCKHIAWIALIPMVGHHYQVYVGGAWSLVLAVTIGVIGYIMYVAIKKDRPGVGYIMGGAIATLTIALILVVNGETTALNLSSGQFWIAALFLYTSFPLGLSLYVNNRYGDLFSSMEKEVSERTAALRKSMDDLNSAQDQLIQQEKLASLGQLTAGIAHEIKNPLNFVNNFSEVSLELIEEAREEVLSEKSKVIRNEVENREAKSEKSPLEGSGEAERSRGVLSPFEGGAGVPNTFGTEVGDDAISAKDEASSLILEILDDIEANLRKIHEHGSRADSIVQSMLQHSRGGDGKMEPTPLNPLIKEYVNLAFHGMRAGKEAFDVDIQMDLDESIGDVPLIAEDFSRVILNLCNNGFDAMRTLCAERSAHSESYNPKLTIRTKSNANTVTLEIEDNGPGIPDEIKDKILQPFFTTKKGTQGTGLGLSITNDIVKAHGGQLDIKTEGGDGSVFVISLPAV